MVKLRIFKNLLFKPKYKLIPLCPALRKKTKKIQYNFQISPKNVFSHFPIDRLFAQMNVLSIGESLNEVGIFSSLDSKYSFYSILKDNQQIRATISFSDISSSNLDAFSLKLQKLFLFNSSLENKKRFLCFIVKEFQEDFSKQLKLQDYLNLKKKKMVKKRKHFGFLDKNFDLLFKGISEFKCFRSNQHISFFADDRARKLVKSISQGAFLDRVLRSRIFLFYVRFRKLYMKKYAFLTKNKLNLLRTWSAFLKSEHKCIRASFRRKFSLKKLVGKRRRRKKWRSFLLKYRAQIRLLRNFSIPIQFEINYKTLSLMYLDDPYLLTPDSKVHFELEIRKLLTFLSS